MQGEPGMLRHGQKKIHDRGQIEPAQEGHVKSLTPINGYTLLQNLIEIDVISTRNFVIQFSLHPRSKPGNELIR